MELCGVFLTYSTFRFVSTVNTLSGKTEIALEEISLMNDKNRFSIHRFKVLGNRHISSADIVFFNTVMRNLNTKAFSKTCMSPTTFNIISNSDFHFAVEA